MAVYVYTYAGFPDDSDRKYYVGDYRKRNAYTYQVVPQLQREFDRRGVEEKDELPEDRFKKLRGAGHLYTENRAEHRTPLYGSLEVEALSSEWHPLARWLAGNREPGEVDWRGLGAAVRERLESGRSLPDELATAAASVETDAGGAFAGLYDELRRWHVERSWFQLVERCPFEELSVGGERQWDPDALEVSGLDGETDQPRLPAVVRETRPARGPADEREWRDALGGALELGDADEWSAIFDRLGDRSDWFETVEYGEETPMRVPADELYELQWRLGRRLAELGLHHECATAREVEAAGALHVRYHAGAKAAAIIEVEGYPERFDRSDLRAELRLEAESGAFRGWSDEGLEALEVLLVDPESERLSGAAPSSAATAEFLLWEFDEGVCRRAERGWGGCEGWAYSRCGDELIVSTREPVDRETVSAAASEVAESLRGRGMDVAEGGISIWSRPAGRLESEQLLVPERRGGSVGLAPERRERISAAVERVRESEADESDRRLLRETYRSTGDLRFAALGSAEIGANVRELLCSLALGEFQAAIVDGWYGASESEGGLGEPVNPGSR